MVGGDFPFDAELPELPNIPAPEYEGEKEPDWDLRLRRLVPEKTFDNDNATERRAYDEAVAVAKGKIEREKEARKGWEARDKAKKDAYEAEVSTASSAHAEAVAAYNRAWNEAREPYERIAYCGKVPVLNAPKGCKAGDWLVAVNDGGKIGLAVLDLSKASMGDLTRKVGVVHSVGEVVIVAVGT
jgi:hypothetical protein